MSSLAFTLRQTVVPVVTKLAKPLYFPVRRIYCAGPNYDSHAREMGGVINRTDPFFFVKPTDCLVTDFGNHTSPSATIDIRYPPVTESYHHEVELVVALGYPTGKAAAFSAASQDPGDTHYSNMKIEEAADIIYAYGVGLDMTRRDLQLMAKNNGKPWDLAKGADGSAVVSPLVLSRDLKEAHPEMFMSPDKDETGVVSSGSIFLQVNQNERQRSDLNCMACPIVELLAHLSKYVALKPGDLLFTGTPSGVSAVRRGDVIEAGIQGLGTLKVNVM
ncbi:Fumarylacetoacetate (FAA) hydrolase family, putative [Leishmania lindenbergi]|uniref:Fumarylacetoacetate (FAA) hydrolase family n=1 Tax=Leishmania lindenbergi TaxID=651832 RepID=A0AAW2ZV00_9TRYP